MVASSVESKAALTAVPRAVKQVALTVDKKGVQKVDERVVVKVVAMDESSVAEKAVRSVVHSTVDLAEEEYTYESNARSIAHSI